MGQWGNGACVSQHTSGYRPGAWSQGQGFYTLDIIHPDLSDFQQHTLSHMVSPLPLAPLPALPSPFSSSSSSSSSAVAPASRTGRILECRPMENVRTMRFVRYLAYLVYFTNIVRSQLSRLLPTERWLFFFVYIRTNRSRYR